MPFKRNDKRTLGKLVRDVGFGALQLTVGIAAFYSVAEYGSDFYHNMTDSGIHGSTGYLLLWGVGVGLPALEFFLGGVNSYRGICNLANIEYEKNIKK